MSIEQESITEQPKKSTKKLFHKAVTATRVGLAGFVLFSLAGCDVGSKPPIVEPIPISTPFISEVDVTNARNERTQGFNTTEAIIAETDKGFSALAQRLQGKLDSYSSDDQQALLAPIQLYDANRENPSRNAYSSALEDLNTRGKAALEKPGFIKPPADSRYFFMGDHEQGGMFVGSFSPMARTIALSPQFKGDNLYEMLVAYHEVEHTRQDTEIRAKFIKAGMWDKYLELHYYNDVIVGRDEQEAYLKESFIFDALTDGKLKRDIVAGTIDLDWYMKFLNARPEQKQLVQSELEIVRQVFISRSDLHNFTPDYKKFVYYQYRNRIIVDISSDNKITLVK